MSRGSFEGSFGDDPADEIDGPSYDEILAAGRRPAPRTWPTVGRRTVATAALGAAFVLGLATFVMSAGDEQSARPTGPGTVVLAPSPAGVPFAPGGGAVPEPFRVTGSGNAVVEARRPEAGTTLLYLEGTSRRLAVWEVDDDDVDVRNLAVVEGPYRGVMVADLYGDRLRLRVEAVGPWTIELRSARSAPVRQSPFSGSGDDVFWYTGRAGLAEVATTEPMPVAGVVDVDLYTGRPGWTGVATMLDEGTERVRWPHAGPVLVQVRARSGWRITVTER